MHKLIQAIRAHLPRRRIVHPAPTSCPCCGGTKLSKIGEDVTEQFSSALRQARERLQRARLLADRVDPLTEQHRALIAELRLAAEDLSSIARGRQERDLTKP